MFLSDQYQRCNVKPFIITITIIILIILIFYANAQPLANAG